MSFYNKDIVMEEDFVNSITNNDHIELSFNKFD